jgi:hypothetical protein
MSKTKNTKTMRNSKQELTWWTGREPASLACPMGPARGPAFSPPLARELDPDTPPARGLAHRSPLAWGRHIDPSTARGSPPGRRRAKGRLLTPTGREGNLHG